MPQKRKNGRTEHTYQIAMRTMQLNPRKPRVGHQPGGIDKLPRHGINILLRHLPRRRERQPADNPVQQSVPHLQGDRARRNRRRKDTAFACDAERLPARMTDLHDRGDAVLLAGFGVFGPCLDERRVGLFACVLAWQGRVERTAQVVDVDLDVPYQRINYLANVLVEVKETPNKYQ